jgi:hypothetical protein
MTGPFMGMASEAPPISSMQTMWGWLVSQHGTSSKTLFVDDLDAVAENRASRLAFVDWEEIATLPDGRLQDSRGVVYNRTPVRIRRANGKVLVQEGAMIVTSVYPEGERAYAGQAALTAWVGIAPLLVEGRPPPVRDLQWTGRLYQSETGRSLLYFVGDH